MRALRIIRPLLLFVTPLLPAVILAFIGPAPQWLEALLIGVAVLGVAGLFGERLRTYGKVMEASSKAAERADNAQDVAFRRIEDVRNQVDRLRVQMLAAETQLETLSAKGKGDAGAKALRTLRSDLEQVRDTAAQALEVATRPSRRG